MANEEQIAELRQQLQALQEQNQQLTQAVAALTREQQQQQQQPAAAVQNQELLRILQALPNMVAASVAAALPPRKDEDKNLVDLKGLGRPQAFTNIEKDFPVWTRKVANFVAGVHPGARDLLAWSADAQETVTVEKLTEDENLNEPEDVVKKLNDQLYTVLTSLTDGDSFDIVYACPPGAGFEAWRRLNRRWDPATAGRARKILRDILSPARSSLDDLQGNIERLEDLMRRYCLRRDASGARHELSADVRMASLEQLLPEDLENTAS